MQVKVIEPYLQTVSESEAERWKRAVAALRALAALPFDRSGLPPDPVEWQREIRKDRPLHGRED